MGIHKLKSLLKEKSPKCLKDVNVKSLLGTKLAVDASMTIYQFLVQTQGYNKFSGVSELTDSQGNLTGHLVGIFNRSIMMLENGIKPIWVFDGTPPEMKMQLLGERKKKKEDATEKLSTAIEADDEEAIRKYASQTVKITKTMVEDAKTLVRLLGLPVVEAPSEAESQCVELVKAGVAYGVVSEDMDCLTFGVSRLYNGFNKKDEPIVEISLEPALKDLELNMDEFIDMCILCGCDYTGNIANIGPTKAHKFIKEYGNIEGVIEFVKEENLSEKRKSKYLFDEDNFKFKEARELFKFPKVIPGKEIEVKF